MCSISPSLAPHLNPISSSSLLPVTARLFFLKPLCCSSSPSDAGETEQGAPEMVDRVKLAFSKAESYKKSKASIPIPKRDPVPINTVEETDNPESQVPESVRIAMEKAREYKNKKASAVAVGGVADVPVEKLKPVERNGMDKSKSFQENSLNKKETLKISTVDFLGLDFSEKKKYRGRPPGLVPVVESPLDEDFPEVELIVGDASKFRGTRPPETYLNEEDDMDFYKPKVSTWGVFPRPSNISKTFGGGRVIRPGEQLETSDHKAAKEERSRELIAAYKKKMGLTIDTETKLECEKALREGDSLMDSGKLQEALPYYERVMKAVIFQSELHGLAALQWSICQDSLRRPNEARTMYEKLQSHPNVEVSKKARQFVFSFQAMDMMKVTSSSLPCETGYENYFEAFVDDKPSYSPADEEQNNDALREGLLYIMFLLSPILLVFFAAVRKSSLF